MIKMISSLKASEMILPSAYADLFFAACETYGAEFICPDCGYMEEWKNRRCEKIRCNCASMCCNGVMILTIKS